MKNWKNYTVSDFWEVGASGTIYSKETIFNTVLDRFQNDKEPDTSKWKIMDFKCRQLGEFYYLVTYHLDQDGRKTRRATVWYLEENQWKVVYHQGTIISA